uniref:Uncharacterized protein n=1 Tax=Anguilla anguilla TaxID=7936 RepID=A0A0E9QGH8_ANGAN
MLFPFYSLVAGALNEKSQDAKKTLCFKNHTCYIYEDCRLHPCEQVNWQKNLYNLSNQFEFRKNCS